MLVLIRGAGDLASGIALRLHHAHLSVVMTDLPQPTAIRRTVCFSQAIVYGSMTVEDVTARFCAAPENAAVILAAGEIPVLADPEAKCRTALRPDVVVDAILAKKNLGTRITDAPCVIGVGPGFTAGEDCHAAGTKLEPEQMAALTAVATVVAREATIPVGIDAAFCDPMASLAIAVAVGATFIRVPVFVDTVVTSDGIVKPCARELQRYRKLLGAENIALLCDIQTKHTFMLSSAISIEESALMATECGADALIITGAHTGSASPLETIRRVREVTKLPLIAGSGVNAQNAADQLSLVEAAIVGSAMKPHGKAEEPIDEALAAKLMQSVKACR